MKMDWICKNCETKNEAHQSYCYVCGALRDEINTINEGRDSAKQSCKNGRTRPIDMDMKNLSRKTSGSISWIISIILAIMMFLLAVGEIK